MKKSQNGFFPIICMVGVLTSAGPALANSACGHPMTDSCNPWFIQNTEQVRYCIRIEAENFGVSADVADAQFQAAVNYWKNELSAHNQNQRESPSIPDAPLLIATQNFVRVPCEESAIDLYLQLGTLTPEQSSFIPKPNETIVDSVSTSYDRVNLRGRGFIYVAPERGPLAPEVMKSDNAWQNQGHIALKYMFAHELGHVFGARHYGSDLSFMSLMSKKFPQQLLSYYFYLTLPGKVPYFETPKSDE